MLCGNDFQRFWSAEKQEPDNPLTAARLLPDYMMHCVFSVCRVDHISAILAFTFSRSSSDAPSTVPSSAS